MARRQYKRLTAAAVKKLATRPGRHPDGDGLYLKVGEDGAASWIFRYLVKSDPPKKERFMGLGSLRAVGLAEARQRAEKARGLWRDRIDPIEAQRAKKLDSRLKTVKAMTFKQCAEAYVRAHAADWRSLVHAKQWAATLATHVYPVFGDLPVAAIDTPLVLKALEPLWNTTPETATRVRGRIEKVLDSAVTAGYRPEGALNPARWKGHLETMLAKPAKAKQAARQAAGAEEHHAALPYRDIGTFMAGLRQRDGAAACALEFAILTAGRTKEVRGARWSEIDPAERMWTVPAERMKMRKEHRVPLSDAALTILAKMAEIRNSDFVFPGHETGKPIGPVAMMQLLKRMGCQGLTVHGFRSCFRDWAAETTNHPREACELALAHAVGSDVEQAYRRGDMVEKRRALMRDWAGFCDRLPVAPEDKVVPLPLRGAR